MSIDIGRMISEIQSAQSSPSAMWARRDLAAEKETALDNENYRKRRLLEMQETGATTRTGMTVAGNADVQNIANTGAMARAQLGESGLNTRLQSTQNFVGGQFERTQGLAERVAGQNYELGGRKIDEALTSAKHSGRAAELQARGIGYKEAVNLKEKADFYKGIISLSGQNRDAKSFQVPDAVSTPESSVTPAVQPTAVTPARQSLLPKPAGAQSMTFRSGVDPAEEDLAKKKSRERLLYGAKPQEQKRWYNPF